MVRARALGLAALGFRCLSVVIGLVAVGASGCKKTPGTGGAHTVDAASLGMRDAYLQGTAASFAVTSQAGIWGVLVEVGQPGGPITLAALPDGRARLSLVPGAGIIEDRGHARVRSGAQRLCELAANIRPLTRPTKDHLWPKEGWFRAYLLTDDGLRLVEADAATLGDGRHALSALFLVGNDLITKLRVASLTP